MRRCSFIEICCLRQQTRDDKKLRKRPALAFDFVIGFRWKLKKFFSSTQQRATNSWKRKQRNRRNDKNIQSSSSLYFGRFSLSSSTTARRSLRLFALPVLCSGEQGNKLGVEDTRTFFGEHIKMLTVRVSSTFLSLPKSSRSRFPL